MRTFVGGWGMQAGALACLSCIVLMLGSASLPAAAAKRRIVDGDTIRVGKEEIRLTGFDTPETASAKCRSERRAGLVAKRVLTELLHKRRLTLHRRGTDKYGRTLARGEIGGRDVADDDRERTCPALCRRPPQKLVPVAR